MKERPNLNELAKEIYEANKAKGWHDREYSNEHYLCLVISELMEAVEADRKGNRANIRLFNAFDTNSEYEQRKHKNRWERPSHDVFSFQSCIKDTIEDELADAVIRLLDLAGEKGYNELDEDFGEILIDDISFTENILIIVDIIRDKRFDLYLNIETAINNVEILCKHMNIDLWLHVDLKIKYNKTRPYKHGKEY